MHELLHDSHNVFEHLRGYHSSVLICVASCRAARTYAVSVTLLWTSMSATFTTSLNDALTVSSLRLAEGPAAGVLLCQPSLLTSLSESQPVPEGPGIGSVLSRLVVANSTSHQRSQACPHTIAWIGHDRAPCQYCQGGRRGL